MEKELTTSGGLEILKSGDYGSNERSLNATQFC